MPGVSDEQIQKAREIDLLSYLSTYEPQELIRDGPGRYTTATHGSLVISNGKWNWNAGGVAGYSALDFLIKVRGMGFVSAVEILTGERAESARHYQSATRLQPEPERSAFYPPRPVRYPSGIVSYLQKRGIHADVINRCLREGILYESRYYNPRGEHHNAPICVFAGKNESGEIKFAAQRGINIDLKRDKSGSDKRFGFCIPAVGGQGGHVAVFESATDAMSHATFQRRQGWNFGGHRLALGGTSDVALISFLERNPQIHRVVLHLDNDRAGIIAARKIKDTLAADRRFCHISVSVNPPRGAKDYNELLIKTIQAEQEQKQHSRAGIGAANII